MAMTLGDIVVNIKSDTSQLTKGFKRAETTVHKSARIMTTAIKTITAAYIGLNAIDLVGNLVKQADTMTLIDTRLKLATKSTEELTKAQKELFDISQEARVGFSGTVDLFERITRSTRDYATSQTEIIGLTETINKAMVISGGTAQSMNAAIIQLGQAFSADFQAVGQELASIREQAPRLYQALLEGTNLSSKAFKKHAEDGKLSTQIIIDALKSQSESVETEFKKVNLTVDQSQTKFKNSSLKIVGSLDEITGASRYIAESISDISKSMDEMTPENIEETTKQIKVAAITIASMTIAVKGYTTASALATSANILMGGSYGAVNRAILLTTVSTKALTLATKALPYVAIATAIYLIADAWVNAEDAAKKYQDQVDKNSKGFTGEGILADRKYETSIKNLVTAFDKMEGLEKAYLRTSGTQYGDYYKGLFDDAKKSYLAIEKEVVATSDRIFNKVSGVDLDSIETGAGFDLSSTAGLDKAGLEFAKQNADELIDYNKKVTADFLNWKQSAFNKNAEMDLKQFEIFLKQRNKAFADSIEDDDSVASRLSETLQTQMTGSIVDGIEAGITDGSLQGVISNFAGGFGKSVAQAYVAEMIKAQSITGAGLAGLGVGIGIMAISSLFGGDDGKSAQELADERFDSFMEGLDKASEALEAFGNVGSSMSNQIASLQENIAKYSKAGAGDISTYRTTSSDVGDYLLAPFTGGASAFETRYKAVYDGQTFRGDSRAEVEGKVNDYKNAQIAESEEELLVAIESSLADTLDISALTMTQIQGLVSDIDVEAMKAYETELNNIALSMKLGTESAGDIARATEILSDTEFARYQDLAEAINLVDEAVLTSTENFKTWTDSFKTQGELLADMANDTISQNRTIEVERRRNPFGGGMFGRGSRYYDVEVESFTNNTIKVAESFEELDKLALVLANDVDGLTDADLKFLEANKSMIEGLEDSANRQSEITKQVNAEMLGSLSYLSDIEKLSYANNLYRTAITPEDRVSSSRAIAEISQGTTRTREEFIPDFQRYISAIEQQADEATTQDVVNKLDEVVTAIEESTKSATQDAVYGT